MWDPLESLLPAGHTVLRHELRGFGETPLPEGPFSYLDDLEGVLDEPAVLVGASFGGLVALSVTARVPELVCGLVLIDAPLADWEFGAELRDYWDAEAALVEDGDLAGAADLNVSFWVGGADAAVRDTVREMSLRGLELQVGSPDQEVDIPAVSLPKIHTPTLVLVGSLDREDFQRIAARLGAELPRSRSAAIEGAAHLPAMEQPEATAREIVAFLASL